MKHPKSLRFFATQERIHSVKKANFIIVIDVVIRREEALRLKQADLTSYQGRSSIDEHKDSNVCRFPPTRERQIPMRSTEPSKPADIVSVHTNNGTRWQKGRG